MNKERKQQVAYIGRVEKDPTRFVQDADLKPLYLPIASSAGENLTSLHNEFLLRAMLAKGEGQSPDKLLVVSHYPEELIEAARTMQATAEQTPQNPLNPPLKDFLGSLVILKPDMDISSVWRDEQTGIQVVNFKKGQPRFPIHPTPDS